MGGWNPVANLREYVFSNPPGCTFFLCVLTLAITFLSLSSYSRTHTLPNPDTAKDWNHLLSAVAQLTLCERVNTSSWQATPLPPSSPTHSDHGSAARPNSTTSPAVASRRLAVPLVVSASLPGDPPRGDVSLHTTLRASQLNMGGDERVAMTLELVSGNDTHSCLSLVGPDDLMPTRLLPPECLASKTRPQTILVEVSDVTPPPSQHCYSMRSTEDPTLTVMLTKEERGLAVHHLLEFSVCLFVLCFLFCVAASLSHTVKRHQSSIGLDDHNEPLIHNN